MQIYQDLFKRIDEFCFYKKISHNRFGLLVCNNHKIVKRIKDNKSITLKTLKKINDYIDANIKNCE